MSEVVSFQKVLRSRAALGWKVQEANDANTCETPLSGASRPLPSREDIYRAILLLDLAAQHARLLVKKIAEPSRRQNFEAQTETIEQLLQVARNLASNL